MDKMVYTRLRHAFQSLLPSSCLCCEAPGCGNVDICAGCFRDLPRNEHACTTCALPVTVGQRECGRCQDQPPPFSRLVAPWRYAEPVDGLIQALKFRGQLPAGRLLGTLLARELFRRHATADVIVPLPLHRQRLRERGFNQATEIARCLPQGLGIPLRHDILRRAGGTIRQSQLGRRQRVTNIRGAFATTDSARGLRIALVDDVVTTGSTIEEAARTLLRQGAVSVEVWAVARATLSPRDRHTGETEKETP